MRIKPKKEINVIPQMSCLDFSTSTTVAAASRTEPAAWHSPGNSITAQHVVCVGTYTAGGFSKAPF